MGDLTQTRMTAQEFMALPETTQPTELLDGELIVSPTPKNPHQDSVLEIALFLRQNVTTGKTVIAPMDVHFDDKNIAQPDVFWVSGENSLCKLGQDGYWYGAPDLVVEALSPSTEFKDRGTKFKLYEKYGGREYWLVSPEAKYVEVYRLVDGQFARVGIYGLNESFVSEVLSGMTIKIAALLE